MLGLELGRIVCPFPRNFSTFPKKKKTKPNVLWKLIMMQLEKLQQNPWHLEWCYFWMGPYFVVWFIFMDSLFWLIWRVTTWLFDSFSLKMIDARDMIQKRFFFFFFIFCVLNSMFPDIVKSVINVEYALDEFRITCSNLNSIMKVLYASTTRKFRAKCFFYSFSKFIYSSSSWNLISYFKNKHLVIDQEL